MNILEFAKNILGSASVELAAEIEVEDPPSIEDQQILYMQAVIVRANAFLDKRKEKVFADVLSPLNSSVRVERALGAYGRSFLLGLGLSLEATSELAKELINYANIYKLPIPNAWKEVAAYDINLPNSTIDAVTRKKVAI